MKKSSHNTKQLKRLNILEGALKSIESEIRNEEFGLVIDGSGGHRPGIVNDNKIFELKQRKHEIEKEIETLQ